MKFKICLVKIAQNKISGYFRDNSFLIPDEEK